MHRFLVINGPNLNCLGKREPHHYGGMTLSQLQQWTEDKLQQCWPQPVEVLWRQSQHEGEIIEWIHQVVFSSVSEYTGLIINPGGYSHTSVAIMDAMLMVENVPVIEVHLSSIYRRESFRQRLLTAKAAKSIMSGFGRESYFLAMYGCLHQQGM